MPSTNSPNKGYELQATGENAGTWGVILNSNALSIIDLNFGGRLAKSVAGSSNVTITTAEARNFKHTLTGLLTGNIDYIVPNGGSSYIIYNNTTGAFTVTVKPDGGTGIVVPQGKTMLLFANPTTGAMEQVLDAIGGLVLTGTISPSADDGAALGTGALGWSDLFLAIGGIISWGNGDVTITHSTNALTFAGANGGFLFSSPLRSSSSFFGLGSPTTATIASGVITATSSYVQIDTEGAAATDDLDTINGGVSGDVLVLYSTSNVRDPTIKDGTGNLRLAGDFVMSHTDDRIILLKQGSIWFEISRSDNA